MPLLIMSKWERHDKEGHTPPHHVEFGTKTRQGGPVPSPPRQNMTGRIPSPPCRIEKAMTQRGGGMPSLHVLCRNNTSRGIPLSLCVAFLLVSYNQ